ncbi:BON domain-containing protein [Paradesulfitobacterium aromaticivorans]
MQKRSEKEILTDLKELMQTHFGESGEGIRFEVRGDRVNLWGTVDSLAEKNFIGDRVSRVDGVQELDNSLTVALDGEIDDKDIEEEIIRHFGQSRYSEIQKLGCQVSRGIVTLLGHVETRSTERLAQRLAMQVRGVKEIRSEIQMFDKYVNDAALVNMVEDVMVDSPWVNAQEIKTSARKGVVTLIGLVDTQEELEWAVETAYQVPGVKAVVSEIFTRHRSQGEDLRLTEQLVAELGRHGLNSAQVRAVVQNRIAFLTGEVYSDEDREIAETLVQNIHGISQVNNAIQVATHWSK